MKSLVSRLAPFVSLGFVVAYGCHTTKPAPTPRNSAQQFNLQATRVDYVDSDAFDLLFETTLLNAPPVVVVQTDHDKPEWGARLNAWIAAWNAGRRTEGFRIRGQIPGAPGVVVDGDSIREFRLLIDGLMNRAEESARTGTRWWAEKHLRDRRVALLKPYSLRFHLDANERIQLIFFHGDFAAQHESVVRALANPTGDESLEWAPDFYCCSRSKESTKSKRLTRN